MKRRLAAWVLGWAWIPATALGCAASVELGATDPPAPITTPSAPSVGAPFEVEAPIPAPDSVQQPAMGCQPALCLAAWTNRRGVHVARVDAGGEIMDVAPMRVGPTSVQPGTGPFVVARDGGGFYVLWRGESATFPGVTGRLDSVFAVRVEDDGRTTAPMYVPGFPSGVLPSVTSVSVEGRTRRTASGDETLRVTLQTDAWILVERLVFTDGTPSAGERASRALSIRASDAVARSALTLHTPEYDVVAWMAGTRAERHVVMQRFADDPETNQLTATGDLVQLPAPGGEEEGYEVSRFLSAVVSAGTVFLAWPAWNPERRAIVRDVLRLDATTLAPIDAVATRFDVHDYAVLAESTSGAVLSGGAAVNALALLLPARGTLVASHVPRESVPSDAAPRGGVLEAIGLTREGHVGVYRYEQAGGILRHARIARFAAMPSAPTIGDALMGRTNAQAYPAAACTARSCAIAWLDDRATGYARFALRLARFERDTGASFADAPVETLVPEGDAEIGAFDVATNGVEFFVAAHQPRNGADEGKTSTWRIAEHGSSVITGDLVQGAQAVRQLRAVWDGSRYDVVRATGDAIDVLRFTEDGHASGASIAVATSLASDALAHRPQLAASAVGGGFLVAYAATANTTPVVVSFDEDGTRGAELSIPEERVMFGVSPSLALVPSSEGALLAWITRDASSSSIRGVSIDAHGRPRGHARVLVEHAGEIAGLSATSDADGPALVFARRAFAVDGWEIVLRRDGDSPAAEVVVANDVLLTQTAVASGARSSFLTAFVRDVELFPGGFIESARPSRVLGCYVSWPPRVR